MPHRFAIPENHSSPTYDKGLILGIRSSGDRSKDQAFISFQEASALLEEKRRRLRPPPFFCPYLMIRLIGEGFFRKFQGGLVAHLDRLAARFDAGQNIDRKELGRTDLAAVESGFFIFPLQCLLFSD